MSDLITFSTLPQYMTYAINASGLRTVLNDMVLDKEHLWNRDLVESDFVNVNGSYSYSKPFVTLVAKMRLTFGVIEFTCSGSSLDNINNINMMCTVPANSYGGTYTVTRTAKLETNDIKKFNSNIKAMIKSFISRIKETTAALDSRVNCKTPVEDLRYTTCYRRLVEMTFRMRVAAAYAKSVASMAGDDRFDDVYIKALELTNLIAERNYFEHDVEGTY